MLLADSAINYLIDLLVNFGCNFLDKHNINDKAFDWVMKWIDENKKQ